MTDDQIKHMVNRFLAEARIEQSLLGDRTEQAVDRDALCFDCKFFDENQCRRHAPRPIYWDTVVAASKAATESSGEPEWGSEPCWPKVSDTDWCGEFRPAEKT